MGIIKDAIIFTKLLRLLLVTLIVKFQRKSQFMSLPGVEDYTASAVLSIAFNKNCPVLDGNVKRVMSRIIGIKTLTKYNLKELKIF